MTSPYNQTALRLIDNGYSAIPIMPGTKRPGDYRMREWWGTSEWQRYCERLPTEIETGIWQKWPDAGVCVALNHELKVIDIDTDDSALMAAVLSVLPDSEVKKRGNKGFSAFYRGSRAIVSAPFSVGKTRVVDLLAHGRQTVLPPTIHPDTGKPYHWLGSETLEGVDIASLPLLPDNVAELLATALEPFGYVPEDEHHRLIAGEGETYWREVNDTALKNLPAWVPDLRLGRTTRHGKGYRAVADWRPELNSNAKGEALSFHPDGIKDWGEDKSYTPIDLVMLATRSDMYTATKWLRDRLGMKDEIENTDGFDIAGFIARSQAKAARIDRQLVAPSVAPLSEPIATVAIDTIRAPRGKIDPFYIGGQGGLIQEISEWILETSRAPVPEFATIAAITFLGAFFGRRYVTPTELGLNIYMIGIAGPGFGKDHPRRAIEMLGHSAGFSHLIGPNDVTSDSAIEKVVRRRPCFVMPFDEVGVLFQAMTGKNAASWARSIRKSLLELYSKSTSVWTGKEKAEQKEDSSGDPVWFPTVSMLGMSTPSEFYAGITEANFGDGFMARLTIIGATTQPKRQDGKSILKIPLGLVDRLKHAFGAAPGGNLKTAAGRDAKQKPVMHSCQWGEGAYERWKAIETWQLEYMIDKPEYEGIVGRTAEQTQKIAAIRAIGFNPSKPVVDIDDIEWAYAIVQKSIDMIDDGVRKHMASSEFETLHKLILSHVEDAGEGGISKSILRRKKGISAAKNQDYDGAIKYLQETDQVDAKIMGANGGRPGLRYFAIRGVIAKDVREAG